MLMMQIEIIFLKADSCIIGHTVTSVSSFGGCGRSRKLHLRSTS